jgi:hypothetical protein
MADQDDDQQTSDDQSGTQATESDPQTSQDQVTGQSAVQTTDDQVGEQQNSDDQSSGRESQTCSQHTSDQDTSISFDVEGDVPAIAQPPWMVRKCETMPNATGWNLRIMHCWRFYLRHAVSQKK